jgi:hypothetical protein
MKVLIWIGCFLVYIAINIILHPLGFRLGYGLTLVLVTLLPIFLCKKWDVRVVEKEAHNNGVSVREYVRSKVPPSLMDFCEANKGNRSTLKKTLKNYITNNVISKPIANCLYAMYK